MHLSFALENQSPIIFMVETNMGFESTMIDLVGMAMVKGKLALHQRKGQLSL